MEKDICLRVNDKDVPLNGFVKNIFINTVEGMVGSLSKLPDDKVKIDLTITKKEK